MDWYIVLILLFSSVLFLMIIGIPVAFSFLIVIIVSAPLVWGLEGGMSQVILSLGGSLMNFSLLPIPLFILMGEIISSSRIAPEMIDAIDKWIGRIPGRLSILAVAAGVLFSTLTGTSLASTAMLGGTLVPEMENRGYKKPMSIGPILGSAGLALMIPPSSLAVLLGAIAEISIGALLIAIIIPGIIMALLFVVYIIVRCLLQPDLAPVYNLPPVSLTEKLSSFVRYILPVGFIIFMVVGVIYFGVATPTEASATGALSCLIYTAFLGRLNVDMLRRSLSGTIKITIMIYMIVSASELFSQLFSYTGAAEGLVDFVLGLDTNRIIILLGMQFVVFMLGMFLNAQAIMMITLPVFMPIIYTLEFNPIWFGVIFLLNVEIGAMTPPFGMGLFVMKGVAPKGTTMGDVIRASVPFLLLNFLTMAILIAVPDTTLWLVRTMN